MNTAKQNYPGRVASYDTRPGNEVNLFYKSFQAHTGQIYNFGVCPMQMISSNRRLAVIVELQ